MDIYFDEEQLAVKYDEDIDNTLQWEDVTQISAYKVYTYPGEVTFLVFSARNGETIEASDEMSGWLELLGGLGNIFKLPAEWQELVADAEAGGEDVVLYTR
ncbi:hypothetical protein ACFOTA_07570 [Chitinophaga sp. GCM10012297]|uniref:Uncharacterized protein n=1 Tax=Chitinophaga chungangae TaxID=2821488 RepID=A0ABS3YBK8_9BACT|nr:hypothetical protein [Chitinophaga chungangae]MBO9152060.1 hypothetical protein [Chitinophaga chungangae]